MIGEEDAREVSAFASHGEMDRVVDPLHPFGPATSMPTAHQVGHAIDARWWLAALALGAALWTVILSV